MRIRPGADSRLDCGSMRLRLPVLLTCLLPTLMLGATNARAAEDAGVPDAGAKRGLQVRILDPDGLPLVGSHVRVVSEAREEHDFWLRTDERGAASAPTPAPGRYRVLAYWLLEERFQRYVWEDLDVRPGTDDVRVELRFRRGSAGPITGQVRGLDGLPVAGAEVRARQLASSMPLDGDLLRNSSAARELASTTTDAEGRFTLSPLHAGEYGIQVLHSPAGLADVTARTGGPALELQLVPRCVGSVAGRVVDERGTPVRSFQVDAQRVRDAKGRFRLKGACYVHFEAQGFVPRGLPLLSLKAQHVDLPDVVLERGRQLTGRVLGPEGKPLKGVELNASWDGITRAPDASSSNAGGHFSLGPVPMGRDVTVWAKWDDRLLRQQVAPGKEGKVELRFPAGAARLEVLARDAEGAPLGGLDVLAESAWGSLELRTDAEGRVAASVPPGKYAVRITHKPSGRVGARGVAYRFAPVSVELAAEPGAPLEVRALRGTGRLRVVLPQPTHYKDVFVVPGAHDWPADIPAWAELVEDLLVEDAVSDPWVRQAPALIYYGTQDDFSELVPGPYTVFARNPRDDGPGLLLFRQVVQVDGRGRQVVQARFEGENTRRLPAREPAPAKPQ
jgi:hypothetical protein